MTGVFEPFVVSDGDGPGVVLVHGSWTDHRTWDVVVPLLTDSLRVMRYDRRGHSGSTWTQPVARRQDEDDLASLIEASGAPMHVVASSYGGSIALALTARRPDLVASLAVHEPPLLGIAGPGTSLGAHRQAIVDVLAEVSAEIRRGRRGVAARRFVEEVALGPGSWAMLPADARATMVANAPTFVGTLADPDWDVPPEAVAAMVPVLLSDGAASPSWLRSITEEVAAAVVPHATRLTFPAAGHVPHVTDPVAYAAAIRRFITTSTHPTLEVTS